MLSVIYLCQSQDVTGKIKRILFMPVIKSAIKKLRQDKKREKENNSLRTALDKAVRLAKKTHTEKNVSSAFSVVDKAVKKNIIHKNKAAHIKSLLSKLLSQKTVAVKKVVVKKPTSSPSKKKKPAKSA